jgi:hypothetical protein
MQPDQTHDPHNVTMAIIAELVDAVEAHLRRAKASPDLLDAAAYLRFAEQELRRLQDMISITIESVAREHEHTARE